MDEGSTFLRKIKKAARSILLANALLGVLTASSLVNSIKRPPAGPEQPSASSVLRRSEWRQAERGAVRIQQRLKIDQHKLATEKLDQPQLLKVNDSLILSAKDLSAVVDDLKNQPLSDASNINEIELKRRVEGLEKRLAELRKKLEEERRKVAEGVGEQTSSLYERAEALADLIRELLELRDFVVTNFKKDFVHPRIRGHPDRKSA